MIVFCQVMLCGLTGATEVSAAGGDTGFDNGCTTAGARLPLLPKNTSKVDVAAPLALGIDVIFVGGATLFDAKVHNIFDFGSQ